MHSSFNIRDPDADTRPLILLIDDEASVTSTLTTFLQLSGFNADVAHDGEEALSKLKTISPDLIMLDVLMPRLDGRIVYPLRLKFKSGDGVQARE